MKNLKTIENKINKLPSSLIGEVEDFVDFLLNKNRQMNKRKLQQNWAGSLKDFSDKYSSVELQKKALEWMSPV